jgi:hypothetical protein
MTPALIGLVKTGVRALRNSVYARGGVIGVLRPSSCLMMTFNDGKGLLHWSSDGKVAVLGVLRG